MIRTKVEVDGSGLRQLQSVAKQRSITLKAIKAGAKIVQQEAKSRAPKRTGALKQSLGVKSEKGKKGKTIALAVVGPRKKVRKTYKRGGRTLIAVPAFYAHLVEKGTQPHPVSKGEKIPRAGRKPGEKPKKKPKGIHPGSKPNPFLGPALASNTGKIQAETIRVLGEEVQKAIEKASVKAAKKGGKK